MAVKVMSYSIFFCHGTEKFNVLATLYEILKKSK